MIIRRLALALAVGSTPAVALASNYVSLSIDKSVLSITDLRSPRQSGDQAETFEVLVYRAPAKARRGKADYVINKFDFDCARGRVRRNYSASFDLSGKLVDSDPKPKSWAKVDPLGKQAALRNLGCQGAIPKGGLVLGDLRVGQVIASYRAGAYDRSIK